ncbi:hypothetical protein NXY25_03035 [Bacteroides thetaiotaomicron]|nr:hypothetical protein [Bacteroides thetaiotaomicron]
MKNLTWQNPEQLFVAQELINKVKSKCCGIKDQLIDLHFGLVRIKSAQKRINTAQTTSEPLFRMLKERLKSKKE